MLSTCYHKIVPIHHELNFSTLPAAQLFESLNLSLQIIKYPSNSFFSHPKEGSIGPSLPAEEQRQCREDDRKVCSSHTATLSQHLKVYPYGWLC